MKMRKINDEEKRQLRDYFINEMKQDEEYSIDLVNNYFYVVIEDYISDGPGYVGKVLFAMYGLPEFYEVFIFNKDGKLEHIDTDLKCVGD